MEEQCSPNSSRLSLALSEKSTEVVLYPDLFPEEPISVEEEIRKGIKELKQRQRKAKLEKRSRLKCSRKEAPKVIKVVFPAPAKFRGCRHNENVIIDREILDPKEHLRLLATPRIKPKPEYPRWVMKTIPAATNHIKLLAQPKPSYLRETITQHSSHLKPQRVEKMTERLNSRPFLTIPESKQFARQQKRDERRWQHHRERQARKLKKRIVRLELAYLRDLMEKVYRQTRSYFLNDEMARPENELALASNVILTQLCDLVGAHVPERDGDNILDQYYCELADKVALWMWKIMQASGVTFERPEDVAKRLSAASSIFEDPTLRPPESEEEEGEGEAEELVVDEEVSDIVKGMLESCIAGALLALHDTESHASYSNPSEYTTTGPQSFSQTMMAAANSEETTKTERDKGSKVNFMPRMSSVTAEKLGRASSEGDNGDNKVPE